MTSQSVYDKTDSNLYSSTNTVSFGFPSPLSTNQNTSINKKPPVSAPSPLRQKQTANQGRPESLKQGSLATSPESQLLDKWSEDLQQYEEVLDSLASNSLDNTVKEQIKHVDQWYCYLGETERIATIYALLKHSTPLQIRFFITVLQQLEKQDPVSSLLSPACAEYDTPMKDATTTKTTSPHRNVLNNNSHRHSLAFGELDESPLTQQSYTSLMESGGILESSSSSSSSGGRNLSDDFLDIPGAQSCLASATPSGWPHHKGLGTGNPDTASYYRHIMTSPESADISHRSLGVSPHNEGNNNTNTKSKTTSTSNQQPTGTYLSFGTGALSMTPTTTRISGHFDNLASPTAVQFSDSIIRSANNIKTNSKRSSDIYPLPHPSSSIDQWPVYATKLDDTENLRRRSQYNNNTTDGSHHHYISPQQPSTYTINNMNGDERFIHRDDCVMTTQGPRQTNHHHFTGNRYHSDVVNIKLMQDVPAWLKSLRLHKYTHLFETMTWQAIISLTNDELVEKGVATLGARRKLLKVFDQVKQHCDMMNIKHETE